MISLFVIWFFYNMVVFRELDLSFFLLKLMVLSLNVLVNKVEVLLCFLWGYGGYIVLLVLYVVGRSRFKFIYVEGEEDWILFFDGIVIKL